MQEERLIYLMRVSQDWYEPHMQNYIETRAQAIYLDYEGYELRDLSAVIRWEILDGEELLEDGLFAAWIEEGIPYFCIWEISETLDKDGNPIDHQTEAKNIQTEAPKEFTDKTGVPVIGEDDLSTEAQGGNDE